MATLPERAKCGRLSTKEGISFAEVTLLQHENWSLGFPIGGER
jgi:hypothetical protein